MSLTKLDPKNLFPKLFKFGWYQWRLSTSNTINLQLNKNVEPQIYNSVSNLFENYFDFEFTPINPKTWVMDLPPEILNKIGAMNLKIDESRKIEESPGVNIYLIQEKKFENEVSTKMVISTDFKICEGKIGYLVASVQNMEGVGFFVDGPTADFKVEESETFVRASLGKIGIALVVGTLGFSVMEMFSQGTVYSLGIEPRGGIKEES